MTLEQLRIFVAVAEREHVTQAARALNMTQSATSAAITALERRYATKLFDRIGRRIALTEAGRLFLIEARAVLARAAAAEKVLADLAGLKRGALSLAASQTVANYWLPQVIERYRTRYPGIAITQTIGNTEYVAGRVHDGLADLGFAEGAIDDPALVVTPVAEDELVLVAPRRHPWARRPPRSAEEIAAGPWVLREPGSGTRAIFEAALPGLGLGAEGPGGGAGGAVQRGRARRRGGRQRRHRHLPAGRRQRAQGRHARRRQARPAAPAFLPAPAQGALCHQGRAGAGGAGGGRVQLPAALEGRAQPPDHGRFGNLQPALHGGAGEAALQPCRHRLQGVELNQVARAVEADQVAHPAERGDVGDGVVLAHDPWPPGKALLPARRAGASTR